MQVEPSPGPLSFDALLAPVGAARFFAEHWEKKPLLIERGDARHYDPVLSMDELEGVLSTGDLRYPALQLARHGGYFPPEVYTRNVSHGTEAFQGVPDLDKVQSEYRSGATIVLPALQRSWAPLRELCDSVEAELSHAVHANGYLTPGNTVGFTPHYDTHEVFVLQIGGTKRWRVYPPPVPLPHRSQPFPRDTYTPPAPELECELSAGDLLYLPRGYVHAAATTDRASAHVTLGITVYTWVELLSELLSASKTSVACREALPVGFARRDATRAVLRDGILQRLDALRVREDFDAIVETFTQRVRAARARPRARFRVDVNVLGRDTVLEAPDPGRYVIGAELGNTTLELDGRQLVLPSAVRPILEAMRARSTFRLADLPRHLDEHATLAFVRFLVDEGFLTPRP